MVGIKLLICDPGDRITMEGLDTYVSLSAETRIEAMNMAYNYQQLFRFAAHKPDVVILDVPPGHPGIEIVKSIQSFGCRVIVFTDLKAEDVPAALIELKVSILFKSSDKKLLLDCVKDESGEPRFDPSLAQHILARAREGKNSNRLKAHP